MDLSYTPHEKLSLRQHPVLNEAWLHDRICDKPEILGLGEVRVLDRERTLAGGGRLDLILHDEGNDRRYEVEIQLGATDPSHIIRTIEYWDLERRRYPAYDHVAVIVAEDVTTRFLNVLALLSGSISLIAIQLDALKVQQQVLLNFVHVLDLTEQRTDDANEESGGGLVDRTFWMNRGGEHLLKLCDAMLDIINTHAASKQEFNYLRGYIGLRSNGVVRNIMHFSPTPMKKVVYTSFHCKNADDWVEKFSQAGIVAQRKRGNRYRVRLSQQEFDAHRDLIEEAIKVAITDANI